MALIAICDLSRIHHESSIPAICGQVIWPTDHRSLSWVLLCSACLSRRTLSRGSQSSLQKADDPYMGDWCVGRKLHSTQHGGPRKQGKRAGWFAVGPALKIDK